MDFKMGKATREAFGHALVKLGDTHPDVVVVDGDVHNSTHTGYFAKKFPERKDQIPHLKKWLQSKLEKKE